MKERVCSGQSEVITIVILTGVILAIAVVTLYFGGDLLNRTSSIGEFVSAQSSLISFANMISQRASVEGAAGSVVVPTKFGDLAITSTNIRIYFKGVTVLTQNILAYNGSTLNATIYYASYYASGTLVSGGVLEAGSRSVIYGGEGYNSTRYPVFVDVYYDYQSNRWVSTLNTTRVLYTQLLENKTVVYILFIEYSEDYRFRVDSTDSTLLKFYVREVSRETLPSGEVLEVYFNDVLAGRWGGSGQQITLIFSKMLVEASPIGG